MSDSQQEDRPATPDDPPISPPDDVTPPTLPEIPTDFSTPLLDSILTGGSKHQPSRSVDVIPRPAEVSLKIQKRANQVNKRQSNVLKLSQENDKLKEELRAMTERLEAAERRRQQLEIERRGKRQSHG